ncbi:MAG: hypothetical protein ACM3Q2_09125 [Syntrophothermus sp.]
MKHTFFIILFLVSAALLFILWQYVLNIYEVRFDVSPPVLYADSKSETVIEAVPLNAFGWKAPFRKSASIFEITEGEDLVQIIENSPEEGRLVLRAGDRQGLVVVKVTTKYSLWPSIIEIPVKLSAV